MPEWRPIPGHEGWEVSEDGQVRSLPRRRTRGRILKTTANKRGYLAVGLGREKHEVHRLVAAAFLGECPIGCEVRHLDGDRLNPSASNLAYGTRSENNRDKRRHGTDHNAAKSHCPQGHPYDESNTYVLPSRPGARYCKECGRRRGLARYHARKGHPDYDPEWLP